LQTKKHRLPFYNMTRNQINKVDVPGFTEIKMCYLRKALIELHRKQPPPEKPKEPNMTHEAPRGITHDQRSGNWRAYGPTRNGKQPYIGVYPSKEDAINGRALWMEKNIGLK
jgi:hypothetical protein